METIGKEFTYYLRNNTYKKWKKSKKYLQKT